MIRRLRRRFGGSTPLPMATTFERHRDSYLQAIHLVRLFYIVNLYLMLAISVNRWAQWLAIDQFDPLWMIEWVRFFDQDTAINFIAGSALICALAAIIWPQRRVVRLLLALTLLQLLALNYSFGKIDHNLHAWVMMAILFVFLPDGNWKSQRNKIGVRQQFLTVFVGAQAFFLLFYTSSGVLKWVGAIEQLTAGQVSLLHPNSMANQIAHTLLKVDIPSVLGMFFLQHALLGWLLYLGAVLLETFSIVVLFRPKLHRTWGIFLIALHLGNALILSIIFNTNILLIAMLLVYSPFQPDKHQWRELVADLPVIGRLIVITDSIRASETRLGNRGYKES